MRVEKAKVGFTLVEMAVVLVIIGLILTVTLPLLTEGIQRDKLTKGRQGISSLRDEIIGYALTHDGVLPTLSSVSNFASAEDPWGNLIAYWSDPAITEGAATDICTLSSAPNNLSLQDINSGSTYSGVAFIIASRGANHNLQEGYAAGNPVVVTTYPNGYDDGSFNDFDHTAVLGANYDVTGGREERFDDVVQYVTYNYLRTRICTSDFGSEKAHAAVTFDDMTNDFGTPVATGTAANYANQNAAIETDAQNGEISLGNDNIGAVGCLWWAGTNASLCGTSGAGGVNTQPFAGLCSNGTAWKKARFVFKFTVTSSDESTDSDEEKGGFVFTLLGVNAASTVNSGGVGGGAVAPCGQGNNDQFLAYSGNFPSGTLGTVPNTVPPKYGVEVDYYPNTGQAQGDPRDISMLGSHDPTSGAATSLTNDESPNHIAVVFWGTAASNTDDNSHGVGAGTAAEARNPDWDAGGSTYDEYTVSPPAPTFDGFMSNATHKPATTGTVRTHWLEDGKDHWIRIVFERGNASFSGKMLVHVWVSDNPSAAFKNVGADLLAQDPHGQAGYDLYENSTQAPDQSVGGVSTNEFRFGWTTATGGDAASTTILSDFAFNLGI